MKKSAALPVVNKKAIIGVALVAALLLAIVLIVKLTHKPSQDGEESSSPSSSSVVSSDVSETVESEVSSNPPAAVSDSESVPAKAGVNPDEQSRLAEAEKIAAETLTKQAADQILTLGGEWSLKEDPKVNVVFTNKGKCILTGSSKKPVEKKYKILSAEAAEVKGAEYAYRVHLKSGDELLITALAEDRYTLQSDTYFAEAGKDTVFAKTAKIVLGSQKNPNGVTDEEKNRESSAKKG